MSIIILQGDIQESLKKEPYLSLRKGYEKLNTIIHNQTIDIILNNEQLNKFHNGFYCDNSCSQILLKCMFLEMGKCKGNMRETEEVLIKMEYSYFFDGERYFEYHTHHIESLKKRVPYFFIPNVEYLDFRGEIEDGERCKMTFWAIVEKKDYILQTANALLSLLIALFAFES